MFWSISKPGFGCAVGDNGAPIMLSVHLCKEMLPRCLCNPKGWTFFGNWVEEWMKLVVVTIWYVEETRLSSQDLEGCG